MKKAEKIKKFFFISFLFFLIALYQIPQQTAASEFIDSLSDDEKKFLLTKKTLVSLCDYNFPPFEFMDPKTNAMNGFNVDLMNKISKMLNVRIIVMPLQWEKVIPALLNNEGDIIQGIIFTKERNDLIEFSVPFLISSRTIFFNKLNTNKIRTISDLKERKVAIQRGDVSESLINSHSDIEKIFFNNQKDGLLALQNNMVDAFIGNRYLTFYLINKLNLDNIIWTENNIHTSDYCIGLKKNDIILKNIMDKAIKKIKNSNDYDDLMKKWFTVKVENKHNVKIYFIISLILIVISFFFILTFIWVYSLRKAIRSKTEKISKTQDELILQNSRLKEANEQLKKLDSMKDNFLSNVSHELRTPLVSILGYMNLLETDKLGKLEEKQEKAVKIVRKNINKLLTMITTLLDVTKNEEYLDKNFRFEYIDLTSVVNNNIYLYSPMLEQRKIKFSFKFDEKEKFIIKSKRQFVEIIISNVITNGIKYNRDNGNLFIELTKDENWFILIVKDTGIGIESAQLGKIFEKFYQIDNKITTNSGGFGLGLYLVKKYIDIIKGKVEISSKPGEGTTFKLYFNNKEHV